ncbi:hypothetical protein RJ639_020680 [Escallonia herrerae]|uniref:Retrovirus-related Pol polyprotein from transposon RE1 n=1 Tax=Escallonia herrerae TaxID=1293975 RepID=A0AA89AFZ2_9ASTE|nr:hypothetical protein RJ639_020680 [Escallonia herrerae]
MTNPDFETYGTKSSPIVIQSEGSSFKAGIILNDTNYDLWSQIMEMHIAEKEKLSFIQGNSQPPTKEDDLYEKWYADNQKVKRWLLMSMSPEIMKRYIRLPTARDIWKALSKAFYDGSDELQVFVLNQRAFSAKQSGRTLSAYYGELTEIFGELDHRDKVIMESENDVESYRKSVQRQRVHIFLAGLDGEFEQVRAEILRKDPIPELEACHALICRESVRRTKMDIRTRQTIGCGVRRGKLYYLDLVSKSSDKLRQALMNGVAGRKNRHLLEVVRASLIEAHLPLSYWGEALISAAYLINWVPSRTIDYQTPSQSVDVYTDADWAGAVDDRRSTSGYFTFVGGILVTWRSKKQNVVARSSAEAEFRGIALGVCEALWLRLLLQDLGCVSKQPIKLYCDNKVACDIAHNPVQHDRTKHVEIERFFIKEKLDEKIVELPHIRSEDQLADILTKAVSSRVFLKFLSKLGMWDIYAPT